MNARPIFRWLAILGLGGFGASLAVSIVMLWWKTEQFGLFQFLLFFLMLAISWSSMGTAYCVWRRRYQEVCITMSRIMGFLAYSLVDKLMRDSGLVERLLDQRYAFASFVGAAGFVLALYAGKCAYRLGRAYLPRIIGLEKTSNGSGALTG